jgi:hypothetical protein
MKAFYAIVVSVLIFTACEQQRVKTPDAAPGHAPLVIDYPAGVLIGDKKQTPAPVNRNASFAEKILSPHSIPVLDTSSLQMVFVKTNGDRITISMEELEGRYDIILFNAVSNPVPLRIADLENAMDQIFKFRGESTIPSASPGKNEGIRITEPDTIPKTTLKRWLSGLKNRDRRIIVSTPDTSAKKFVARIIPGIQWVEQRVDTRTILTVNFENDLITYANTDRYFTNGITFDLQAAWLGRSFAQKLMIPYRHTAFTTYNLSMVQDMYTPTDTRVAPSLSNDRPYSSYLYFGYRKTTADAIRKLKISTQIDAGYIGPYSPGSYMQTLVHKTFPTNDLPLGWETQINTDIILNYGYRIQKALVKKEQVTLLAGTELNAGTLYNNAGAGLEFQAGKAEPVFGQAVNEHWPESEYYFFAKTDISFVAYNALLQGGLFNHNNVFTLEADEIHRVVGKAEAGIHVRYRGIGMELSQHFLSPEYKGGLWHKWGKISLLFRL